MSRLAAFFPDYQAESVYELTPEWFRERGFRGLILDIDNTLVSPHAPADETAIAWTRHLKEAGLALAVLSNNSRQRAESFAAALDCPFVAEAGKPRPEGFMRAMEMLGTDRQSTLVIGDQLLTDVYGAHRAGLKCLLVDALDPAREQPFVRVKRLLEKPIRRAYGKAKQNKEKNS